MLTRLRRRLWMALGALAGLIVVGIFLGWVSTDHFRAFGGSPSAASLARMHASPRFVGVRFENAEATTVMLAGSYWTSFKDWAFRTPPESGLRITWLGHSTTLIEIDGVTILTDPVWSERASPSRWIGPRRFHPPPLALADLPHLDAVIISHEHYDHLDMATVQALAARGVAFHVPLGIGGHLEAWGVAASQIVEHDWWESSTLAGGVRIVSTPARHFNGRGVPWRIGALWTSWSLVGASHRVFVSGDTGLTDQLGDIAAREGPFDIALLEIGQYHPSWGSIHLGPVGAVEAGTRLGAKTLLPIHWSTFELGYHAWSEPAETFVTEAARRGVAVATPRLGEPVEPGRGPATSAWWRALPPMAARCP